MTDMGVKTHACHTRSTKTPRKGHGMSVDKEEISRTVLELDKEFNKRWSNGDNRGYLDAYTDDATYFEPAVKRNS